MFDVCKRRNINIFDTLLVVCSKLIQAPNCQQNVTDDNNCDNLRLYGLKLFQPLSKCKQGNTLLHAASTVCCWQIVEKIINFMKKYDKIFDKAAIGDFVNQQNKINGETALIISCMKGDCKTTEILCDNYNEFVDVSIIDKHKKTSYEYLSQHRCYMVTYDLWTGELISDVRPLPENKSKNQAILKLFYKFNHKLHYSVEETSKVENCIIS